MDFLTLQNSVARNQGREPYRGKILAWDPGETTGYAVLWGYELVESGQIATPSVEVAASQIMELRNRIGADIEICEDYRVYGWKTEDHAWNELITAQVIGAIKTFAALTCTQVIVQSASTAKTFCTDKKLREWGFYVSGQRHARDAIRHACYYGLFLNKRTRPSPSKTPKK